MDQTITVEALMQMGAIIMGAWAFVKIVREIIKAITDRHDREQKWDEMSNEISKERQVIVDRYDDRLKDLEKKIDENHCDTEAKIQELKSSMMIQLECIQAILKGLEQLKCNGPVTEAKDKLDQHLREKAYE